MYSIISTIAEDRIEIEPPPLAPPSPPASLRIHREVPLLPLMCKGREMSLRPCIGTTNWSHESWGEGDFYIPTTFDHYKTLRDWLYKLPDGSMLKVRGRDVIHAVSEGAVDIEERKPPPPPTFTPYEYGIAIKFKTSMYLLWEGKVECFSIGTIDFHNLLNFFVVPSSHGSSTPQGGRGGRGGSPLKEGKGRSPPVIVLCHGFSFEEGPNYPFIRVVETWLRTYLDVDHVIVPDYRPSYKFGPSRGRSERVRITLEALLEAVHLHRGRDVILVGHSQGGAACAQTCASLAAVKYGNVKGLVMMGSESPVELLPRPHSMTMDGDDEGEGEGGKGKETQVIINLERPAHLASREILLIHSNRDRVISPLLVTQLGDMWGVKAHVLETVSVAEDEMFCEWSNDVQHDFMAKELLPQVFGLLENFLNSYYRE